MHNGSFDRLAARLAARQFGVLSRDQVVGLGATEHMVRARLRAGVYLRMHPGVYRIAGSPPAWLQSVLAACLSVGERAAASHLTASPLWRFPGFAEGVIDVS